MFIMLKTIKSYLPFAILIVVISACENNSADPEFNYNKINAATIDSSKPVIIGDTSIKQQPTTVVSSPALLPAAANTAKAATGLNPEHGKPGHRCDISVGAPLNSKPNTVSSTPQQPVQVSTTPKTVTAAGMNPPHGEPGHKCEIAVGAPLNSKPVSPLVADTSKK